MLTYMLIFAATATFTLTDTVTFTAQPLITYGPMSPPKMISPFPFFLTLL